MKKIILGLFLFFLTSSVFAADKVVVLTPYSWSTFSTPKVLSDISIDNGGAWIYFYTLSGWTWQSVEVGTGTIKPLEWYMVYNSNSYNLNLNLTFKQWVTPTEWLFSKNLNAGWNLLWISSIVNPFSSIWSNTTMAIDFTKAYDVNYLNTLTNPYSIYNGNSSLINMNLDHGEAYAIFMSQAGIYWGSQITDINKNLNFIKNDNLANSSMVPWLVWVNLSEFKLTTHNYWWATLKRLLFKIGHLSSQLDSTKLSNINLYINWVAQYSFSNMVDWYLNFEWRTTWINIPAWDDWINIKITWDFDSSNQIWTLFSLDLISADVISNNDSEMIMNNGSTDTNGVYTIVKWPIYTFANASATLWSTDLYQPKQLLQAWAHDQRLLGFTVSASNDNIKLKDIVITWTWFNNLPNLRLTDSNMNVVGWASNVTNTWAIFTYLDNSINSAVNNQTKTFILVADINPNTDVLWINATVKVSWSDVRSSNDSVISMTWSDVTSASHDIAQNTFKVVKNLTSYTVYIFSSRDWNSSYSTGVPTWTTLSHLLINTWVYTLDAADYPNNNDSFPLIFNY